MLRCCTVTNPTIGASTPGLDDDDDKYEDFPVSWYKKCKSASTGARKGLKKAPLCRLGEFNQAFSRSIDLTHFFLLLPRDDDDDTIQSLHVLFFCYSCNIKYKQTNGGPGIAIHEIKCNFSSERLMQMLLKQFHRLHARRRLNGIYYKCNPG